MHSILWASIVADVPARHAHPVTFHADFWVVAGTAAPVIALSSILVLGDLLKLVQDFGSVMGMEAGPVPVWEWPFSITSFWYLVTEAVIFLQAGTLFFSLMSLVQGHNFAPTAPIAAAEFISLIVLSAVILNVIRIKPLVKHLEEVHFPSRKLGISSNPFRKSQSDALRRASRYRSSHQMTNARSARRAPQPRK